MGLLNVTTNGYDKSSQEWPDWIKKAGTAVLPALKHIAECHERLLREEKDGYSHVYVRQDQVLHYQDAMLADGIIDLSGKILKKNVEVPKTFRLVRMYVFGSPVRLFRLLVHTKKLALIHLLTAARNSAHDGNLLVVLICFRSIIEHVAHFYDVLKDIQKFTLPSNPEEVTLFNVQIDSMLAERLFATRINWDGLLNGSVEEVLAKKGKFEYKERDDRLDRTANQILNSVDLLSKKIRGLRGVYELLCEFAHPNVGVLFSLCVSAEPIQDKQGVHWVRKHIGLEPPGSLVEATGKVFSEIIERVDECLQQFELSLEESKEEERKIQTICQLGVREALRVQRNLLDPYDECPCASGVKLKFCCALAAK